MSMDTVYDVETPEGIDLNARLVGPLPRLMAFSIDFAIRAGIYLIVAIGLGLFGETGWGIFLICLFLLIWLYPIFFEVFKGGQTPGKKSMGMVVVNQDLTPVRFEASVIRNFLRTVDFLPSLYLFGLVSMCLSGKFQRLGDMAAGTIVIYRPQQNSQLDLPEAQLEAPPAGLSESEQMAIISFARRHKELSQARQLELANILEPSVSDTPEKSSVTKLHGMGNWLVGKR